MLTVDSVLKQLRVIETARREGAVEEPPSHAKTLSATERNIVDLCQSEVGAFEQLFSERVRQLRHQFDEVLQGIPSRANGRARTAHARFAKAIAAQKTALMEAGEADLRLERQYRLFRRDHRRDYDPHYQHLVVPIGIGALMIAAETVLNATFFANASPRGLVGGAAEAAFISIANVTLGFFSGFWFRWKNHNFWPYAVIAWIWFFGATLLAAIFNVGVGHYRDLLATLGDVEFNFNLIGAVFDRGVNFDHLQTYILVLIGLAIYFINVYEGYNSFDPYPGYKQVHQKYVSARDYHLSLVDAVRDDISEIHDDIIFQIKADEAKLRKSEDRIVWMAGRLKEFKVELSSAVGALQRVANEALAQYRNENRAMRQKAEPAYFTQQITLEMRDVFPEADAFVESLDAAMARIADLLNELLKAQDEVDASYGAVEGGIDNVIREAAGEALERVQEKGTERL